MSRGSRLQSEQVSGTQGKSRGGSLTASEHGDAKESKPSPGKSSGEGDQEHGACSPWGQPTSLPLCFKKKSEQIYMYLSQNMYVSCTGAMTIPPSRLLT